MAAAAMKRIAIALSCLLGLLLAAAPAQATWPGGDGAVAFVRGPHIWVQLPSGKQRQLTAEAEGADSEPTYSPDGRTIAFVRYQGPDSDIWVMNSDGTDQRPVTETGDGSFESQVSGNRVLFVRRDNPQNVGVVSRLQLLNLRGGLLPGAPRHRGGEFSPSWQALR
jgi:dipeptidyl aminopeptidase/acylaminoacyl peptidase